MRNKAYHGGYALVTFNIINMKIIQAITMAAAEQNSNIILQASAGARKYAKPACVLAGAKTDAED